MPVFVGDADVCWLCGGSGQITTGTEERLIVCGMCRGTGVSDTAPSSTAEMVDMLADLPGIERVAFTTENLARIDEIEQIVIQCLRQIEEEEDAAQAGKPSTLAE